MKYIIQIIGGLGLLLMLNMCVQAGMISHADIQNDKGSIEGGSQSSSSDGEKPQGFWEIRDNKPKPPMAEEDPEPQDFDKDSGGDL